MLAKFEVPHNVHMIGLYSGTMSEDLAHLAPARLVPVLRTPEGGVVGESLAIAETLAERHPDRPFWPADPALRMRARWLCAEMASGFSALRSDCPMQLQHVNVGFSPSDAVRADLTRVEEIWSSAWQLAGTDDGWLLGQYSLADVFYAPVAARVIGYDLPVSDTMRDYCMKTLSDPFFKSWRHTGLQKKYDPFPYPASTATHPWPVEDI